MPKSHSRMSETEPSIRQFQGEDQGKFLVDYLNVEDPGTPLEGLSFAIWMARHSKERKRVTRLLGILQELTTQSGEATDTVFHQITHQNTLLNAANRLLKRYVVHTSVVFDKP